MGMGNGGIGTLNGYGKMGNDQGLNDEMGNGEMGYGEMVYGEMSRSLILYVCMR